MTEREKNQLAHMVVETYYWGLHEAHKTVLKCMGDMEQDKETDTEDYRDLQTQDRLYRTRATQIEAMSKALIPVIVQYIVY